ncbi:3-hydroxyisobutyrate dehydrogenase-like beta-hydroxyacid dehydrogenase [Microbacterium phyllosphaerae]|uniref:3-hydroxyisobutyrate dehydrogenase-like beta-hydroxyacid dehydrogenase n=1 Tax=Microbacterium phyllosphaerae TaxID=124798 RepID=A0ABS4WLG5_9MICO|nr:NAD(P)-dependent oxidoreductase [Microbacterium phyllosphaerae]MBP2376983.1 3-hydroxyisobutyrate dehydrogenase-like beta-hydroxyacid dehydrogenase [Microbacterium phyllosphaerae]
MSDVKDQDDLKIGFIGIGAMGLPMARNLHDAGFAVTVVDPSEHQRGRAEEIGMTAAASASELGDSTLVIIMVANSAQLLGLLDEQALFGKGSLLRTAIITSTVGPPAVHEFAQRAAAHDVEVIDLAVTGGVAGATGGTLTLLAGAPSAAIDSARPILERLGTVTICGDRPGDGQAVKLVNNLVAAVNLAAVAEGIRFAAGLGLDPANVVEIIRNGAAGSWMLSERGPRMAVPRTERSFDTHAAIFAKDTALIGAVAEDHGTKVPLLGVVEAQFARAVEAGWANEDDTCIVDLEF